jgi:hypothetical protein
MNFGAWIFFSVIVIGFIFGVKNKRLTILDVFLFISIYLAYYFIGYLLHNEMLSSFTFKGDGLTISFVGIILLIGTFLLIRYVINKFIGKVNK